jgi:hypothetical protein
VWSAVGLLAVLAFVALFFIGTQVGAARTIVATKPVASAPATPSAPAPTVGAASPGVHPWTALNGGECFQPFTSAWTTSFTVVDCASAHAAQLVLKGALPDAAAAPYPSATALKAEITPLCTAPTALNYATAGTVSDVQLSLSYPPNRADWAHGDRTFYCFASRSSGAALSGSLAVSPAAG